MLISYTRKENIDNYQCLLDYLYKEEDSPKIIWGDEEALEIGYQRASKYGNYPIQLRHFIISPKLDITASDAVEILFDLQRVYQFDLYEVFIVQHYKERKDGAASPFHYHLIVPELQRWGEPLFHDDSEHYPKLCQQVARIAEAKFEHPIQKWGLNEARITAESLGYDAIARKLHNTFANTSVYF